MLRTIADLTIVCAADANHLRAILRASIDHPGAMYIRLGRGRDPRGLSRGAAGLPHRPGRDPARRQGSRFDHLRLDGARHARCGRSCSSSRGSTARVIDMHTIKPLDAAAIRKAARETAAVMTVEEHNITGGLGSAVTEVLVGEERVPFQPPRYARRIRAGRTAGRALCALQARRRRYRPESKGVCGRCRKTLRTRRRFRLPALSRPGSQRSTLHRSAACRDRRQRQHPGIASWFAARHVR